MFKKVRFGIVALLLLAGGAFSVKTLIFGNVPSYESLVPLSGRIEQLKPDGMSYQFVLAPQSGEPVPMHVKYYGGNIFFKSMREANGKSADVRYQRGLGGNRVLELSLAGAPILTYKDAAAALEKKDADGSALQFLLLYGTAAVLGVGLYFFNTRKKRGQQ